MWQAEVCHTFRPSLLCHAALFGDLASLDALLGCGAVTPAMADGDAPPLWIASCLGHSEIASRLCVEGGFSAVDGVRSCSPLHIATEFGHESVVQVLCRAESCVHTAFDDGVTPVWLAAVAGHVEVTLGGSAGSAPEARNMKASKCGSLSFRHESGRSGLWLRIRHKG